MNFKSVFGIKAPQVDAKVENAERAAVRAEVTAAAVGMSRGEAKVRAYFGALGIKDEDIKPRENVLTFAGWINKGRVVVEGSKGCTLSIWKPVPKKIDDGKGGTIVKTVNRPWYYTCFHESQTKELEQKEAVAA